MDIAAVPIHILVRFADSVSHRDTVTEHRLVLAEHDRVWFGKVGRPLGAPHIARLNSQCEDGIVTYMYLVQKKQGTYECFRAIIERAARGKPGVKEKDLIPQYYQEAGILRHIKLWVRIRALEGMEAVSLRNLRVASSGASAADTLGKSMAGLFLVKEGHGLRVPK